jgi:hypothetical protein
MDTVTEVLNGVSSCHNFSKLFLERNHSNIREEDLVVTAIGVFLMGGTKKTLTTSITKY